MITMSISVHISSKRLSVDDLASQLSVAPDYSVVKGADRVPPTSRPFDNLVVYRDVHSPPIDMNGGIHALLNRVGDLGKPKEIHPDVDIIVHVNLTGGTADFPIPDQIDMTIDKDAIARLFELGCDLSVDFFEEYE